MSWLGAALCFAAVGALVYALLRLLGFWLGLRAEVEVGGSGAMMAVHLLKRLGERLGGLADGFPESIRAIDEKLVLGGRPFEGLPARSLLALALAGGIVLAAVLAVWVAYRSDGRPDAAVALAWVPLLGAAVPWCVVRYRVSEQARRHTHRVRREFPYFLDMMLLVLQAGGRVQRAIDVYIETKPGSALARELVVLRGEMATLSPQSALLRLEARLGDESLRVILRNIGQAEGSGTELKQFVADQASELRFMRAQMAERAAERLKSDAKLPEFLMVVSIAILYLSPAIVVIQSNPAL